MDNFFSVENRVSNLKSVSIIMNLWFLHTKWWTGCVNIDDTFAVYLQWCFYTIIIRVLAGALARKVKLSFDFWLLVLILEPFSPWGSESVLSVSMFFAWFLLKIITQNNLSFGTYTPQELYWRECGDFGVYFCY